MELDGLMHALGMTLQVFFLDLILSGDNALVIAVACRSLPPQLMRKAVLLGTGFAILLRVLLTTVVGFLLQVPLLKLLGAALLISIAIKLLLGDDDGEALPGSAADSRQLWSAVSVVVMADLVLSLDNVVALAAAAQGSVLYLILGLLFSVPLLMYGSLFIARLLNDVPLLIPLGAALLGWVAGQIAVSDPLLADWINTQAPALQVVVPLLCVVFVLVESRIIRERAAKLTPPPPLGWLESLMSRLARIGEAGATPQAAVFAMPVGQQDAGPQGSGEAMALSPVTAAMSADVAAVALASETSPPASVEVVATRAAGSESPPATAAIHAGADKPVAADSAARPARKDGLQASPRMALLVKLLLGLAVLIGVCALGWLVFHLLSQGFLPTPAPSTKLKH
ncbi:YjbE family putative metal transport protein [Aquitalea aquatica]|uniref:YjbE family putative metal transport protein n=1 Tax=Aquitalea aquatica TaxID=3044273 RepID=A0A838Y2M4_9NEIS|nr:YjbE family putative metal transport protein [Aquitalea magnusonii]MBA4708916.1 YjbE family putative metal transport protein [Aquitalea magnusonii]